MSKSNLPVYISVFSLLGLGLSLYALHVEYEMEANENYKALCDISEKVSCTKAFSTGFGKGFGIVGKLYGDESVLNVRNPFYGIVYYIVVILISFIQNSFFSRLLMFITCASNLLSIYLGYLLIFVINSFCVVCVSMYVINLIISMLCIMKHDALMESYIDERFKNKRD